MEILFPRTVAEMQALLATQPNGRVIAGGTDYWVQHRRLSMPSVLFSVERLEELRQVEMRADGLFIGAGVTYQELLDFPTLEECFPVLRQAVAVVGSPPIRHSGTLVGNVCTASPAGDTLPPLYVLGASVEVAGRQGRHSLAIADFITGHGRTALNSGEFVTGVHVPRPENQTSSSYFKVGRRKALAISIASLAAKWELQADKTIKHMKLAWGSVGPTVVQLPQVERFLQGKRLSDAVLRHAGALVQEGVTPIDDIRASAAYRRQLASNLLLYLSDCKFLQ
nr:xanthine dehydrogenase family protein subunit M [uncultured Anaeromusa sp.]